jgi:hypothetical protein
MAFKLDNYVDVPTRLRMALDKYPELRIVESGYRVEEFGPSSVLVCTVTIYRSPDDTHPVVASAQESLPGKTPYTRDSELMVGFTSAIGRALGYMGFGIDKSIASENEVKAREHSKPAPAPRPAVRPSGEPIEEPFSGGHQMEAASRPSGDASPKQLGLLRALARDRGIAAGKGVVDAVQTAVGRSLVKLDDLSKAEASRVIEAWKAEAPTLDEEPF